MATFTLTPIGTVRSSRTEPIDDAWDAVTARIELTTGADSVAGLDAFSHVDVVFVFDRVDEADVVVGARHPRGNTAWPQVGIFAQRAKMRPNRIGVTSCRIVKVGEDAEGRAFVDVAGLDAIDGTPVVDLKPVMREFLPRGEVVQPSWATELMREYW